MCECQTPELQALAQLVERALLSENVPAAADEAEDEGADGVDSLERAFRPVRRVVGDTLNSLDGEAALGKLPALLGDLVPLLHKLIRLARARQEGQRAERKGSARAPDEADPSAAQLVAARKAIKEKEWELVEARRRIDQLEREKARQEQRILHLETATQRRVNQAERSSEQPSSPLSKERAGEGQQASAAPAAASTLVLSEEDCSAAADGPTPEGQAAVAGGVATPTASASGGGDLEPEPAAVGAVGGEGAAEGRPRDADRPAAPGAPEEEEEAEAGGEQPAAAEPATASRKPAGEPSSPASSSVRAYLVDNRNTNSTTKGITYRLSKSLDDKDPSGLARWGTVVHGTDEGDGWIRVGERYLPMMVQVLTSASDGGGSSLPDCGPLGSVPRLIVVQEEPAPDETPSSGSQPSRRTPKPQGHDSGAVGGPPQGRRSLGSLTRAGKEPQAAGKGGGASMPMDLRSLGKLLTGNAMKTPRT